MLSKLRVSSFAISLDGFGAGPNQDLQNPLGLGGPLLMEWFFSTRVWQQMHGNPKAGERASTTKWPSKDWRVSARGSWDAICSAPCGGRGRTKAGKAGGATSHRITRRSLS